MRPQEKADSTDRVVQRHDRKLSPGELLRLPPGLTRENLEALKAKRRELRSPRSPRHSPWWWAGSQRFLALCALIALLPLFGALLAAQKLTMPGPFLFRQKRRGMGGVPFEILKIRTMNAGTEARTALGVQVHDSAVTRLGRFLRTFKLDELPQLWNIVRGDMEFVGPRPIPIALEDEITRELPEFCQRHRVKPGLTNVGQVSVMDNAVGDDLLRDWEIRAEAERHYIANKSFSYDVVLIVLTKLYLLRKLYLRARAWNPVPPVAGAKEATLVLGAPIANLDYEGVIARTVEWIEAGDPHRYVCIAPVHSVVEGLREDHKGSLHEADLVTADGMPVVWAQKMLGYRPATRVYGPTLMLKTLAEAEKRRWRVAFYGGHPERLPHLLHELNQRFPRLDIVYAHSPPFRPLTEEEEEDTIIRLNAAEPDLVWVGLGCPKQERWMRAHSPRVRGVMFGVGAAFDFHAGALRQAPPTLQLLGLEWLFRLWCEPRRLFRRYATTNPVYVVRLVFQVFARHALRRNYQVDRRTK